MWRRNNAVALLVLALSGAAALEAAGAAGAPLRSRRERPQRVAAAVRGPRLGDGREAGAVALRRLRGGAAMGTRKAWAILFGATGFELVSTYYMHLAKGFSVPAPAALAVLFYGASFYAFNLSLRGLELSVAYAVWSAVVMAALSAIGMTFLGERVSPGKITGIAAIILGTCLLSAELAD